MHFLQMLHQRIDTPERLLTKPTLVLRHPVMNRRPVPRQHVPQLKPPLTQRAGVRPRRVVAAAHVLLQPRSLVEGEVAARLGAGVRTLVLVHDAHVAAHTGRLREGAAAAGVRADEAGREDARVGDGVVGFQG